MVGAQSFCVGSIGLDLFELGIWGIGIQMNILLDAAS